MKKLNVIDEIVFSEDDIGRCNRVISNKIADHYREQDIKEVIVLVILRGAKVFAKDVFEGELGFSKNPIKFNVKYIKAQSYNGGVESSRDVIVDLGGIDPHKDINGKHVLIVDDIYDTGYTLYVVKNRVKEFNPSSVECCVFLEREIEHEREVYIRFVATKTKRKEFFIGYGLDYNGEYRDLPYIAIFNADIKTGEPYIQIFCNQCGESCKIPTYDDKSEFYGLIKAHVRGGYFSKFLDDTIYYRFDICEKCLKKMFDQFKIPVTTTSYDLWGGKPYGDV